MQIVSLILITLVIFYIWFETEGIVEYFKMFKLKFTKCHEFEDFKKITKTNINFPDFLLFKYSNFFTKLINCPICLGVWFGLIICVISGVTLVWSGAVILAIWVGYFSLVKTIKKLNE